jgi:hypothetical protein
LYNSGKLANVVKDKATGEDVYIMPSLKEIEITGKATGAARDMIDTKKSYSKEQYVKEKLPAFAGSLGVTANNLGGNAEGYKRAINTKVAENILKRKPNAKERDLTPYELEIISNSDLDYKIRANLGERFEQGMLSVGNAGSPVEFKNPNLTQDQARREGSPLNIFAPLEAGSRAVRKAIGDTDEPNFLKDIALDPLNLFGLGLIDDLPKLGKAAKALSKERQIAGRIDRAEFTEAQWTELTRLRGIDPAAARKYYNDIRKPEPYTVHPDLHKGLDVDYAPSKIASIKKVEAPLETPLIKETAPVKNVVKDDAATIEAKFDKYLVDRDYIRNSPMLSPAEKRKELKILRMKLPEGKRRLAEYYDSNTQNRIENTRVYSPTDEVGIAYTDHYSPFIGVHKSVPVDEAAQVADHELQHIADGLGESALSDYLHNNLEIKDRLTLLHETPALVRHKHTGYKLLGIDEPTRSTKLLAENKDNLRNRDIKDAGDYFVTNKREASAMMAELPSYAIQRGFVTDEYDLMTPEIMERMYIASKLDPEKDALRILGIIENKPNNFKVLAEAYNRVLGLTGATVIAAPLVAPTLKEKLSKKSKRK